jgi:hypothetical protein
MAATHEGGGMNGITDLMAASPKRKYFAGAMTEERIREAEALLGISFPGVYRAFLAAHGSGSIGSFELYGITGNALNNAVVPNAVGLTLQERELSNLPSDYVVIGDTGEGLAVLRTDGSGGDCGVFEWINAGSTPEKIAETLADYCRSQICG